ncbi:MAG: amino acid adenylation domain-containing protein, partial [bacterium]|nr:amino acid adenylation domain-containing protein [bacterium]
RPPLAVVELPADRPRPALRTYRGTTRGISLSDPLSTALRGLARREGGTLFMVSLAAFLVLLRRTTAEKDLPVGTPIANRNLAEIEGLIGFFVNTLVLRGDLSGDPDFRGLLAQMREVALEAYENQDLPFELLVEALEPDRDLSRPPLFQVMFVLQTLSRLPALPGSELAVSALPLAGTVAKFDITLFVADGGAGLSAALEYNTDLFDASTATRLLDHYRRLLEGVVAAPERRISELALLGPGERHQLLGEWNDTARCYPQERCIHELFETQAATTPEAVAVVLDEERISYRELDRRANQLGHHLRALGVGVPEVLVGICLERSVEMVVGLLGILKAGGAYVPLDPTYPEERLAFMLEDSQARILLTRKSLAGVPASSPVGVVHLDADRPAIRLRSAENPPSDVVPENPGYVLYTSGSTGRPKGVVVSHGAVCNHILWMLEALPLSPDDRVLQKTPFSFDASVWEFWAPLFAGAQVILARPEEHRDPAALTETLRRQRVTILHLVPSLLRLLIEQPRFAGCHDLTRVLSGGEPLTGELRDRTFATGLSADLFNLYGPTEATINATVATSNRSDARHAVPIGRPITNVELYVLDEHLRPLPPGAVGKLYLGGAGLARGYLNQPPRTAERFLPHPLSGVPGSRLYDTGDLARYLPDGNVDFLGRGDHQVKVRGFRIELGEIETVLAACPGIRESVVVVRDTGRLAGDRELVAYLVGEAVDVKELRAFLSERLPSYMVPAAHGFLAALPRLPNGKVDRAALARRTPDRPQPELTGEHVAPRTALEQVLAGMWAELLGVDEVGVHANFFELGGHSLLATQLLSWVRDPFEIELPLRIVFEQPTVAGLAGALLADPAERSRVERTAELLLEIADQLRSFRPSAEHRELLRQRLRARGIESSGAERIPRRADRDSAPLSFAQQRLWFLDQLQPGNASYHMPLAVRLLGRLERPVLER